MCVSRQWHFTLTLPVAFNNLIVSLHRIVGNRTVDYIFITRGLTSSIQTIFFESGNRRRKELRVGATIMINLDVQTTISPIANQQGNVVFLTVIDFKILCL